MDGQVGKAHAWPKADHGAMPATARGTANTKMVQRAVACAWPMREGSMGICRGFIRQSLVVGALAGFLSVGLQTGLVGAAYGATRGPDSLADLVDSVVDAVVNISATQTVEEKRPNGPPGLGPDSPFNDLFDEFFKRQNPNGNKGGGGDAPPRSHRTSSLGSGFIIDPEGIVITNNHVIADANEITVILQDGQKLKAELLGKDPKVDVAVLRVKPDKPLKAVKFGESEKMRVGDWVMAVGDPFGLGGTVTAGIISARNRNIESGPYDNYIQTDAAINKGNSGGPLFNMAGEVIGINTAILSPSGGSVGIGFATPSATAEPVIAQLREFGETRRGWLGVKIQNVDDAIAESLNLGAARGALVAGVDEKGPSKPAGIQAGDVIIKFDGKDVKESRDLPKLVAVAPVGKDVDVLIVRKGKEMTLKVKLGRLEDGEKQASLDAGKDAVIPDSPVKKALGMEFLGLTDEVRGKFQIKEGVKGVVVSKVNPGSAAAEKGIQPGMVIDEIGQKEVSQPADVANVVSELRKAGKKSALLRVVDQRGDVRFVAIAVE
jgi:serine protease Do